MAVQDTTKYIFQFGGGTAEGNGGMKNLLGGKGANLAEMAGHPISNSPYCQVLR